MKTWSERPQERCTVCDFQNAFIHIFSTKLYETHLFGQLSPTVFDMPCAKAWNCALKMRAFIRIHFVFQCICRPRRKSLESQKLFFYCPCRLSLQGIPRHLKTWPSLRRRHCPRHSYFHNEISLAFPLDSRLYVTPAYLSLSHPPPHPTCSVRN